MKYRDPVTEAWVLVFQGRGGRARKAFHGRWPQRLVLGVKDSKSAFHEVTESLIMLENSRWKFGEKPIKQQSWDTRLRATQLKKFQFSCSVMFYSLWPHGCTAGFPVHRQLPKLTQTHVHQVSDAILCLLLPPSIFPSIRVFSNESVLHIRWPKHWSFSFSISPSNEYSGLISFRIDWLGFLAVQGALKSLLQHHSSKAAVLPLSVLFMVQLSQSYMTTGKTIALTRRTFVGKVLSLLFNMLSRLVITFLPGSKCLLISWLQSLSTVILES